LKRQLKENNGLENNECEKNEKNGKKLTKLRKMGKGVS
jgi:hypothetical protein